MGVLNNFTGSLHCHACNFLAEWSAVVVAACNPWSLMHFQFVCTSKLGSCINRLCKEVVNRMDMHVYVHVNSFCLSGILLFFCCVFVFVCGLICFDNVFLSIWLLLYVHWFRYSCCLSSAMPHRRATFQCCFFSSNISSSLASSCV